MFHNQLFRIYVLPVKGLFSRFGMALMDFEFNKPILKKRGPILKDFEKNHTDFEGFATFFEFLGHLPGRPDFSKPLNAVTSRPQKLYSTDAHY